MAVTVSAKNYTLINACEANADWTNGSPEDVTAFYKQGTKCIGFQLWQSGNLDIYITGNWNLSGAKHFRFWFMTTVLNELNSDVNGGVQIYVSDGVNTGYYYISGSTTYPGGWYNAVIDLSRNVDAGTKPDMTVLTTIGLRFNLTATAKKVQSLWIDHLYIGDGLIAYGDDGGSSFDLDDILAKDELVANGWGLIRKISGVYYLVGSIAAGDNAGANSCDFKDLSQIVIFENRKVNSNLYNITVVGNATGTTKFQLGNVSEGNGIQGCLVKSEGVAKYDVICTDTLVSDFKLYGSVFNDADSVALPVSGANREVLNCSFEACGEILASTCKVRNCSVINADTRGLRISSASHDVKDCNFISCPHCVHCNISVAVTFDNLKFSGSDGSSKYDIEHSISGILTVNCTNGSNPNSSYVHETGGGSTTINNAVYLVVYAEDEEGDDLENVQVAIYKMSDDSQLMNEVTDGSGKAEETFNYASDTDIYVRLRRSSAGSTRLLPVATSGKITSGGYTLTAVMHEDVIAA